MHLFLSTCVDKIYSTDRQTDRQGETNLPPKLCLRGGGVYKCIAESSYAKKKNIEKEKLLLKEINHLEEKLQLQI